MTENLKKCSEKQKSRTAVRQKENPECFHIRGVAADEGFEPSQTESESGVLPLHKPAVFRRTLFIITHYAEMSIGKIKKMKIFL